MLLLFLDTIHNLKINEILSRVNQMLFELDADLNYSRPCLASSGLKKLVASQNLLLRPSKPLKMQIDSYALYVVIEKAQTFKHLSPIDAFGQSLGRYYYVLKENEEDGDLIETEFDHVQSYFSGLAWEDAHQYETVWTNEMVRESYEHDFPDDYDSDLEGEKPSYDEFKEQLTSDRYEIIKSWLETIDTDKPLNNLNYVSTYGSYASGVWYPADYVLSAISEIRSLKCTDKKLNPIDVTDFEGLKKAALEDAIDHFGCKDEAAEWIEGFRNGNTHISVINGTARAQVLFESQRKSKRKLYLGIVLVLGYIAWSFINEQN